MSIYNLIKNFFLKKTMEESTVKAIKNQNATLIDVRNLDELENDGCIQNAHHIPLMEIPENIDKIKSFSKPIVIFCKSGGRAGRAKEFLESNGIDQVFNGGGYSDVKEIL